MPIHNSVLQIKPLQIADRRCLDLFWKTKQTAQLGDLRDIELYKCVFFIWSQKRYNRRATWLGPLSYVSGKYIARYYLLRFEGIADSGDSSMV
jgi:hypothetical protein